MANSGHEDDQIGMLGLYEDDINRFGKILRTMNLDNIPNFASNVRQQGHRSTGNNPTQGLPGPCSVSCEVIYPPLCGSFHMVFPIVFADGVKWMLKISANGDHFDSIAAAALDSEARTMQMLRRETSIPVPAVYAFDASSDNALLTPFILMEKLDGIPLWQLWFDSEVPKARLEHFRVKVLQSLAGAMVQLNKFTLDTGGSLTFDSGGTPVGLGGAKVMDGVAIFNKARESEVHQQNCDEDNGNTPKKDHSEAAIFNTTNAPGRSQAEAEKTDDGDVICERGPFSCPKDYFLSNLDRPDPAFRADAHERGTDISLRLFIEWAFAGSRDHDRRFVLTHPDLDAQNVLVAEDGTLTGLIDWDGVAAVPRQVGCAQYPLWLMRDWVPLRYEYDTEKGQTCEDAGYEESSPAELASYRALYAQSMEVEIEKMTGGSDKTTTFGTLPKHEAELTRQSLIMRNLDLSAGDPFAAFRTVNHIIDQIEELTAPEWEVTDSDMDSISSCSSISDSDSNLDSDTDEDDKEGETFGTNEQGLRGMRGDASTHRVDQEIAGVGCIVPVVALPVNHTALKVAEQNQVSQTSSGVHQAETEETKTQESSNMDLPHDYSTTSAPLGWARRLLRFGCNAAENSLRKIAEIGYAPEDAVNEVPEVLTEIEIQHAEALVGGNSQMVEADTPQQTVAVGLSQDIRTTSTQETGELEQLTDVRSVEPTADSQEITSIQIVADSEPTKRITSIPPTVEEQGIPLRKAELLQVARMDKKAERKAHYLYDRAAIKKELKVWESIALAVWCRGVTLEQLQMNQGKIASWVVDTLRAKQEHEDNGLTTSTHLSATAGADAVAAEMVNSREVALNLSEDDSMQSNKEPEEARLVEDVLKAAKVNGDEPLGTSKITTAGVAGNHELESKNNQASSISTIQEVSAPEISILDIFQDNKDEPESPAAILSITQPHARLCIARNSRPSKANSASKRTKKRATVKGDMASPILGNEKPSSSEASAYTEIPNNRIPSKQPKIPSYGENMADRLKLERKNILRDETAARNFIDVIEVQPESRSPSTNGDHALSEKAKAAYSLKGLCEYGTSYLTQIFSNRSQSKENKQFLPSDSSAQSDSGDEEGGSDVGGARSSATSLSDGEAEDREDEYVKEDKDDTRKVAVIAADKGNGDGDGRDEEDDESDEFQREGGRMNEATRQMNHHSHAPFTKGSFEQDESINSCVPRRVYDLSTGGWVDANKFDEASNGGVNTLTDEEGKIGEATATGDGEIRSDTTSDEDHEDRAGPDAGDESSSDGEPPEFEDDGAFDHYTVCNLLGMGELDELRLLRLKDGFLKLLEQY